MNRIEKVRELMDQVLILLREERSSLPVESSGEKGTGSRELALAITQFETGCMWMIRSQFANEEYSPLKKLKAA